MVPCILLRWKLMEAQADSPQIKLELNTEQATVMHNALTISSLYGEKPILKIGKMIKVTMVHAVPNLISGKPINLQMPILLTLAKLVQTTGVKV
jgi:hypothetical protein